MGTNRLMAAAACPRASRGERDSNHGSESATPAPRKTFRRERIFFMEALRWLHRRRASATEAEGVVDDQLLDEVAQTEIAAVPLLDDLIEVRPARLDSTSEPVCEELLRRARDHVRILAQNPGEPVEAVERRSVGHLASGVDRNAAIVRLAVAPD